MAAGELERIARIESALGTIQGGLADHEARIRKIEQASPRVYFALLFMGFVIGGITQAETFTKLLGL